MIIVLIVLALLAIAVWFVIRSAMKDIEDDY